MVLLTVSVGQCGNQIAGDMWGRIVSEWSASTSGGSASANPRTMDALSEFLRFDSRGMPHARAVLVDSEPKAVRWSMDSAHQTALLFDVRSQVVCSNSGRGNNWAFGYHNKKRKSARQQQEELEERMRQASIKGARTRVAPAGSHKAPGAGAGGGPGSKAAQWWSPQLIAAEKMNAETEGSMIDRALDAIRREAERMDSVTDVLLTHSISGGTGSGLGSRILQAMRDEANLFPRNYILAASVFPFREGDTPLQAYNAAMTLKWLSTYADGICAFSNDDLLASLGSARGAASTSSRAPRSSLADINQQITTSLLGMLWPTLAPFSAAPEGLSRLQDTIVQLCPDDKLKFFECWWASSASTSDVFADTWQSLMRTAGGRAPSSVRLLPDRYIGSAHPLQPPARGLPPTRTDPRLQQGAERAAASTSLVTLFGGAKEFEDFRAGSALGPRGQPMPRARVPPPRGVGPAAPDAPAPRPIEDDWAKFCGTVVETFHKSAGLNQMPRCQAEVAVRWSPAFPSILQPASVTAAAPRPSRAQSASGLGAGKAAVIATNRSHVIELVEHVARRAQEMVEARAFLHWFEAYGTSRTDISAAMERLWDVSDSYRSLYGFPGTN